MKKLIEFQENKHKEVIDAIVKFRADNNITFSEAVRRLILQSQNGVCPAEPEPDKLEEIEAKLEKVFTIVKKHIKKHTEKVL